MGDSFKKVQSGQQLKIPAEAFNAFVDAARDVRQRQQSREGESQPHLRQSGIVRLKNASGADRNRFEILGIDRPIFTPADNVESFKNEVAFVGVEPDGEDHVGRFCVLLEPLKANSIGLAVVSGACPVRLDVQEVEDTFAELQSGDPTQLKSGGAGSATILWKEDGTGPNKWAIVRLGTAQPIIRKAEMIDTLRQGDSEPARAWLLKYEGEIWIRTDQQIDLYGDEGFRGVAFGRTEEVDVGDKIDVYYSLEAGQWYGLIGGWYFHGYVVDDIAEGDQGQVQLEVGAGEDQRLITVPAFSPYGAVKAEDWVSVTWNTFSVHWDIGKFAPVNPGCGLEVVDDPVSPDDGKLRVQVTDLAGDGLAPNTTGNACELKVNPGCGIAVTGDGVHVSPSQLAGPGLVPGTQCELQVNPGCGLHLVGDVVAVNAADLVVGSRGLKTVGTCGLEVNPGCGLRYNFDQVEVDAEALAGLGLKLTMGSTCELRANLGCGLMFAPEGTGEIQINPFTIAGKGLDGNESNNLCKLDVKTGCGIWINASNEVEFAHDEVAGDGLTIGDNCELEVLPGCGLEVEEGGAVKVNAAALAGAGLNAGEGCNLAVDCAWIEANCEGVEGEQGPQGVDGPQGPQGERGFQGPQGAQGQQGHQGHQGSAGGCPTITATATCVGPGQTCGVNVTQTGCDAEFSFTLAEGDQGPQGDQGAQGAQGAQGSQGATGNQGPAGSGSQGPQGAQGAQGSTGPQGPQGSPGSGSQGAQGPQGHQGHQGPPGSGSQGPQGVQGPQGPPGMKMAIVPAADDFVALFCVESPDVRFEDTQRVTITGATTTAPIDPSFLEVCEPGTIEVVGAMSPHPAVVGATVEGDVVVLRVEGERPPTVTIRLSGIRRGYRGTRFPRKTREQMHRNNNFWNQAQC